MKYEAALTDENFEIAASAWNLVQLFGDRVTDEGGGEGALQLGVEDVFLAAFGSLVGARDAPLDTCVDPVVHRPGRIAKRLGAAGHAVDLGRAARARRGDRQQGEQEDAENASGRHVGPQGWLLSGLQRAADGEYQMGEV